MATVEVSDVRQDFIKQAFMSQSAVGSALTVIDIAGIVKGSCQVRSQRASIDLIHKRLHATQGRGLGNDALNHLAKADVLFHVVRAFDNDTLSHVRPFDELSGLILSDLHRLQYDETIDPVRDIQAVDQELIEKVCVGSPPQPLGSRPLKDLQTCVAAIERIEENVVRGFDGLTNEFRFETLLAVYACLAGKPYTYQPFAGSIAKKLPKVDKASQGTQHVLCLICCI